MPKKAKPASVRSASGSFEKSQNWWRDGWILPQPAASSSQKITLPITETHCLICDRATRPLLRPARFVIEQGGPAIPICAHLWQRLRECEAQNTARQRFYALFGCRPLTLRGWGTAPNQYQLSPGQTERGAIYG